jgi:hypothetical protein
VVAEALTLLAEMAVQVAVADTLMKEVVLVLRLV